jgi:hypothetical protein
MLELPYNYDSRDSANLLPMFTALTHLTLPDGAIFDPTGGPCATPDYIRGLPPNLQSLSTGQVERDAGDLLSELEAYRNLTHIHVYIDGHDPREDSSQYYNCNYSTSKDESDEVLEMVLERHERADPRVELTLHWNEWLIFDRVTQLASMGKEDKYGLYMRALELRGCSADFEGEGNKVVD